MGALSETHYVTFSDVYTVKIENVVEIPSKTLNTISTINNIFYQRFADETRHLHQNESMAQHGIKS